jgi:SUMO ligase MMS21 Smc5/6 complex component
MEAVVAHWQLLQLITILEGLQADAAHPAVQQQQYTSVVHLRDLKVRVLVCVLHQGALPITLRSGSTHDLFA